MWYTVLESFKLNGHSVQAKFINLLPILSVNRICSFVYALCARQHVNKTKSLRGLDQLPRVQPRRRKI